MTGNVVFSTRYDVDEDELKRYDILTFIAPDNPEITYIKRFIGLPGETIEVKEGKVYADGVELDDSFIKNSQNQVGDGIYEIPEGCYFFMGDNRNNSKDSRFWENPYVPIEDIQAKAKCILFPFSDVGSLCYDYNYREIGGMFNAMSYSIPPLFLLLFIKEYYFCRLT